MAQELKNGKNVHLLPSDLQKLNKRPAITSAIWTSFYSRRVGEALNYTVHSIVPLSEYTFMGKTYGERILNPINDVVHLAAKLL